MHRYQRAKPAVQVKQYIISPSDSCDSDIPDISVDLDVGLVNE